MMERAHVQSGSHIVLATEQLGPEAKHATGKARQVLELRRPCSPRLRVQDKYPGKLSQHWRETDHSADGGQARSAGNDVDGTDEVLVSRVDRVAVHATELMRDSAHELVLLDLFVQPGQHEYGSEGLERRARYS